MTPPKKAALATTIFSLAGVASILATVTHWGASSPLIIFYALLMVHTFFSVRCFSAFTPEDNKAQNFIDVVLALVYFGLAFTLSTPSYFTVATGLLFSISILKYSHLMGLTRNPAALILLYRKIRAQALGTTLVLFVLLGILAGYSSQAILAGVIAFCLLSINYLFLNPLYPYHGKIDASGKHS
ncbi:MAG: hypothetical protein FJY98_00345 [Candidatus Liptonbacteria bacterium]|nr:hypothetical protein [Candidatus Liptonbacteria bacterium]